MELSSDGKAAYALHNMSKLLKVEITGKVTEVPTPTQHFFRCAYSSALDLLVMGNKQHVEFVKPGDKALNKKLELPVTGKTTAFGADLPFEVAGLVFSQDGKTLAVSMQGKTYFDKEKNKDLFDRVEFWDTKEWKPRSRIPKNDSTEFFAYTALTMVISPDGKYLAGWSEENKNLLQVWDTAKQEPVYTKEYAWIRCLTFTPDSKTLIVAPGREAVQFIEFLGKGAKSPQK